MSSWRKCLERVIDDLISVGALKVGGGRERLLGCRRHEWCAGHSACGAGDGIDLQARKDEGIRQWLDEIDALSIGKKEG